MRFVEGTLLTAWGPNLTSDNFTILTFTPPLQHPRIPPSIITCIVYPHIHIHPSVYINHSPLTCPPHIIHIYAGALMWHASFVIPGISTVLDSKQTNHIILLFSNAWCFDTWSRGGVECESAPCEYHPQMYMWEYVKNWGVDRGYPVCKRAVITLFKTSRDVVKLKYGGMCRAVRQL